VSDSTEGYDVVIKVKADGGYWTARAAIFETFSSDSTPVGHTGDCTSKDRHTAISYALTEMATLLDRGAIKLPPP
jgi:hypothetical protein